MLASCLISFPPVPFEPAEGQAKELCGPRLATAGLPKLHVPVISFYPPTHSGDFIGFRFWRSAALKEPEAAGANAPEAQPALKLGIQNLLKGGRRDPGGTWPHRAASGCLAHP